jgi:hypothetical protein
MRSYCYEEVGKQLAMNRPAKKCTRKGGHRVLQERPSTSSTPDDDDDDKDDEDLVGTGDDCANEYSDSEAETDGSPPAERSIKRRVSFQSDCELPGTSIHFFFFLFLLSLQVLCRSAWT